LNFLPLILSRRAELLDGCPKMVNQLLALERVTGPSGRDIVRHPAGAHDDVANVVAGAIVLASAYTAPMCWPAPPPGIGRNQAYAAVEQRILNNPGLGLPGCGYDGSAPPGGWPMGSPQAGGLDAQFSWSIQRQPQEELTARKAARRW
jgi:hypothetical protein